MFECFSRVGVCVCVELVFLSLFLFEVIAVSIMQAERGSERGGSERGSRESKRSERETEREERVGQQPRRQKAINKQTHRLADWNTGIGILVFPSPHHHTGCSSTVNTLQLRMSEASIGFALPFL